MNIFEYAMEKEKHAERLYRELAEKAPDPGFASILTLLADNELKHFDTLKQMKAASSDIAFVDTDILPDAKGLFEKMKSGVKHFNFDESQKELYKKAQEIEAESRDFYLERSSEAENGLQKELFLKLAEEEKKHYFLLDHIIEFVSRPDTWLENAEWHHLDDY
ncbi:MAG: ferritin family protein [bacterium]